jgi:hypothetical protein
MRRALIAVVAILALATAYVVAHWALIELGREVIVLRTEGPDGEWLVTRLWIVDDGWSHGSTVPTNWMHNLKARPIVEVERAGETIATARRASRAHPRIHGPPREVRIAIAVASSGPTMSRRLLRLNG